MPENVISEIAAGLTPRVVKLGKNRGGYLGETVRIEEVLRDCLAAGRKHNWEVDTLAPSATTPIIAMKREARGPSSARVYISTGIHGDEPAGPLAVRDLLMEDHWPAGVSLWICPCLNPGAFSLNRRENPEGMDLNRQYLHPQAAETVAHIDWLKRQPAFDLSLCLHEDWESHGFYVYELNPHNRPSMAEHIVKHAAKVCPIDISETIEGRPAKNGIIRPVADPRSRPDWPEAFFLISHKTPLSYTLEAPSDYPLAPRVAALVAGVNGALAEIAENVEGVRAVADSSVVDSTEPPG